MLAIIFGQYVSQALDINSLITPPDNYSRCWLWSKWACSVSRPTIHIIAHFTDESFQAIDCTSTDNQKQSYTTLHTPETQNRNRQ